MLLLRYGRDDSSVAINIKSLRRRRVIFAFDARTGKGESHFLSIAQLVPLQFAHH